MSEEFGDKWASDVVRQLSQRGVDFAAGLTDAAIAAIGDAFGATVPQELALFLKAGVPVSAKWARWRDRPDKVAADAVDWITSAFKFDIENNGYWHPMFGTKPLSADDGIEQALELVRSAPPLLPIYGHRFLATSPASGPRAVLSVWQAGDSIFYGNDLADYFTREFQIDRPSWAASEPPSVPIWEDLFDLWCMRDD